MQSFLRNKQQLQIKSHKTRHHYWSGCKSEARLRMKTDTVSGFCSTKGLALPTSLLSFLTLAVCGGPGWSPTIPAGLKPGPPPPYGRIINAVIVAWFRGNISLLDFASDWVFIKYGWLGWLEDVGPRVTFSTLCLCVFPLPTQIHKGVRVLCSWNHLISFENACTQTLTAAELTDFLIKHNLSVIVLFKHDSSSVWRCSPSFLLPSPSSHPTLPSSFSQSHGSLEDKHPGPPPPPPSSPIYKPCLPLSPPTPYPFILSSLSA